MCINKLINKINNMNEKWSQKGLITDVSETTEILILNGTPLNNKRIKFLDFIKTINNGNNTDLSDYALKNNPTFTGVVNINVPAAPNGDTAFRIGDAFITDDGRLYINEIRANKISMPYRDLSEIDSMTDSTDMGTYKLYIPINDELYNIINEDETILHVKKNSANGSNDYATQVIEKANGDEYSRNYSTHTWSNWVNISKATKNNPIFTGETTLPINNKFLSVFQLKKSDNVYKHLIIEEDYSSLSVNQNKYLALDVDNSILKHDNNNYLELGSDNAGIKSNVEFDIDAPTTNFIGDIKIGNTTFSSDNLSNYIDNNGEAIFTSNIDPSDHTNDKIEFGDKTYAHTSLKGKNISIETGVNDGISTYTGKVDFKAKEIDFSMASTIIIPKGLNSNEAVNKGQLDERLYTIIDDLAVQINLSLSDNIIMLNDSNVANVGDPVEIILPVTATSRGKSYKFYNIFSAESAIVKSFTGTTLFTFDSVNTGYTFEIICNGTSWIQISKQAIS